MFCLCSSLNKLVKWQCPEIQNDVSISTVFAGLMICVKSHTCTQSFYAESPSWALGTRALWLRGLPLFLRDNSPSTRAHRAPVARALEPLVCAKWDTCVSFTRSTISTPQQITVIIYTTRVTRGYMSLKKVSLSTSVYTGTSIFSWQSISDNLKFTVHSLLPFAFFRN